MMNKQNPLALPNPRSLKSLNGVAQFCNVVDTLFKTVYRVNFSFTFMSTKLGLVIFHKG